MIESATNSTPFVRQSGHRSILILRHLLVAGLLSLVVAVAFGGATIAAVSTLPAFGDMGRAELSTAIKQVSLDLIGEKPRFVADPPEGDLPLCRGVSDA